MNRNDLVCWLIGHRRVIIRITEEGSAYRCTRCNREQWRWHADEPDDDYDPYRDDDDPYLDEVTNPDPTYRDPYLDDYLDDRDRDGWR